MGLYILDERMSAGLPPHAPVPQVPPDRFWTAPDGSEWRVWLEDPPRHLKRLGQTDLVLTFVHMRKVGEVSRYDVVRRVPEGADLMGMSEEVVGALYSAT